MQAHKVLSTPAASAPVGVSKDQADELMRWFVRVLSKGMLPAQLTADFQRNAPTMGTSKGPDDPALAVLKQGLLSVIRLAFRPDLMVPAMNPTPAAPAGAPVPPPTQPA